VQVGDIAMLNMLKLAGKVAIPVIDNDPRSFLLGAIGIRKDGVLVSARNGSIQTMFSRSLDPELAEKSCEYHAEGRALRKMDKGGVLYVARVSRKDGSYCMSKPCNLCQAKIKAQKISKVYYTVNPSQYGIWYPDSDTDKVFTIKS
jgi:deoxycytidylate deaminase